jgi:hypothetical protein
MPQALRSPTEHGPRSLLQMAAAALAPALSGMARETREVAWQDGLDLLATIAGLKPVCLIGRGFADAERSAVLRRVAGDAALPVLEAAPWFAEAEPGFFPDEAALLGYPLCCVAQHHYRALAFERLAIEMLERLAQGDRGRVARLIEAGVEPLPATEEEWRRFESLTAIHPSPSTSVNPCDACTADPASAAAALSRRYDRLAAAAGYPPRT